MSIEKINSVQSVQLSQNIKKVKEYSNAYETERKDEVDISPKAKEALELSKLVNKIAAKNSIRHEKVADAKQKLADGYYFSQQVTEKVAEQIAEFII
ncbi:MAG TPA: flagellar biosynthesis anti-sigma factor FlgM [bacterium]|nr:flagellar biosynthesis anti-sigma factor FlgM [bacterium]